MTNPGAGDRVQSAWQGADGRPPASVRYWEKLVNQAPSDERAAVQLLYHQLLELRTIKWILAWGLLIIPMVAAFVVLGFVTGTFN